MAGQYQPLRIRHNPVLGLEGHLGWYLGALAGRARHSHNLFLNVWFEAGQVGLLLFLALLAAIAKNFRDLLHMPQARYWSFITLIVLLFCMVDSPALIDRPAEPWMWFWLPLAVAINADKFGLAEPDRVAHGPKYDNATGGRPI